MIEIGRSTVQSWECDVVGHLNSQIYIERATEAGAALLTMSGLGPRALAARNLRLEPSDQHMRFLSELRSWRSYVVHAGVLDARADRLSVYCELVEELSGKVSAAISTTYRLRDLRSGERARFPDFVREAGRNHPVTLPDHGRPRSIDPGRPIEETGLCRADDLLMPLTASGTVKTAECDSCGLMQPRFFTAHFINGITPLQHAAVADAVDAAPGAVVENRLVYRRFPRAGDIVVVRSAITAVRNRSYSWVHWMFDLEDRCLIASNEAVAVCMDLAARKSIPLPEHFRARLEATLKTDVRV